MCPRQLGIWRGHRQQPADIPSQDRVPLGRKVAVSNRSRIWAAGHRAVEDTGGFRAPSAQRTGPQLVQAAPDVLFHPSWPCAIAS